LSDDYVYKVEDASSHMIILQAIGFLRLFGPNGTLMTLLNRVVPGASLFLFIIAVFVAILFYRAIHQLEEKLPEVITLMAILGVFSLLLFGDVATLVIVEFILIGAWWIVRHMYHGAEKVPALASALFRRTAPAEFEAVERERAAARGGRRREEREAHRAARDLATAQELLGAAEQAGAEAGRAAETAAHAEHHANEQETAALDAATQQAERLAHVIPEMTSTVALDETAHHLLTEITQNLRTFANSFAQTEIKEQKEIAQEIETLIEDIALEHESEEHVTSILHLLERLSKALTKDIGSDLLNKLRADLKTHQEERRKTRAPAPADNEIAGYLGGQAGPEPEYESAIAQTKETIEQVINLKRAINALIADSQKGIAESLAQSKALARAKIDLHNITTTLAVIKGNPAKLEEALKQFNAALDDAERANTPARTIPIALKTHLTSLFADLLAAHKDRHTALEEVQHILEQTKNHVTLEEALFAKVSALETAFDKIVAPIDMLAEKGPGILLRGASSAANAQSALQELNFAEQREHQKSAQKTLQDLPKNITAIAQEIEQDAQTIAHHKEDIAKILKSLDDAFSAITRKEGEILKLHQQEISRAQQNMADTRGAASTLRKAA